MVVRSSFWALPIILKTDMQRSYAYFDGVLLTVPAPQAAVLVADCDAELAEKVSAVEMDPSGP